MDSGALSTSWDRIGVMGAKWIHKMISKDLDTMTGVCSVCGEVELAVGSNLSCKRGRAQRRKGTHGLRAEEAERLRQSSACAICGASNKALFIDHNHETGEIRGVLCGSCNLALGHLKDRIDLLLAAIRYLEPKEVE